MKRLIIPLVTVAVVASIIFAGCVPTAAPPPPEPVMTEWGLELNPYEGLAIKPDGTPYRFHHTICFLGCEWVVNGDGILRSLIERAGGEYTIHDANFDVAMQHAFIEDQVTAGATDCIIILPVEEDLLVPACEWAMASGVPVFTWDTGFQPNKIVSSVHSDYAGPSGSSVLGDYFVQVAEETGEHIYIYEIWSVRAMAMFQERHAGFNRPLTDHPLITVMESPDNMSLDAMATEFVMDAFTTHPELNGIYLQGGGGAGVIEGLRAMGRLFPMGDPDHVITTMNDIETPVAAGLREGIVDACGTHSPWELTDTVIKVAFTNVILGQPVPNDIRLDMKLVTGDNIDTLKLFGAPADWTSMPPGQWDLWPVLDTTEIGWETPTKAMRMELQGY